MYRNATIYLHFLIQGILPISAEKLLLPAERKGYFTQLIYFLDLLQASYNCAKFHHCKICVKHFKEGSLFVPSILNRVKVPKGGSHSRILLKIVILFILKEFSWWGPFLVKLQILCLPFQWVWAPSWVFLKYFIFLLCELLCFGELPSVVFWGIAFHPSIRY